MWWPLSCTRLGWEAGDRLTSDLPALSLSQGVHESRGVTKDYLRLETLIQKVVSPYLGTYGLYSGEGAFTHSCILGRGRLGLGWRVGATAGLEGMEKWLCLLDSSYDTYGAAGGVVPTLWFWALKWFVSE